MIRDRSRVIGTMGLAREQPFGYTGYQCDEVSGMYFAQAREYQPSNGKFTAEDVMGGNATLPTLNQYSYCWNNPMVFADYDGKYPDYTAIGECVGRKYVLII